MKRKSTNIAKIAPFALQKKVDAYFAYADKNKKPYSITGLALFLGVTRQCLYNNSHRDDIGHIFDQAKLRCENLLEERMISGVPPAGMIFILKNNYGWTDKVEIDQTVNGTISLSTLFDKAEHLKRNEIEGEIIEGEITEGKIKQ